MDINKDNLHGLGFKFIDYGGITNPHHPDNHFVKEIYNKRDYSDVAMRSVLKITIKQSQTNVHEYTISAEPMMTTSPVQKVIEMEEVFNFICNALIRNTELIVVEKFNQILQK